MLKVDNKMEELFLSDSVPKNLTIEFEGEIDTSLIPSVNFYTGDIFDNAEGTNSLNNLKYSGGGFSPVVNLSPYSWNFKEYQNKDYYKYGNYICVTFNVYLTDTDPSDCVYPDRLGFNVYYKDINDVLKITEVKTKDVSTARSPETSITVSIKIDNKSDYTGNISYISSLTVYNYDTNSQTIKNVVLHISKIQVRVLNSYDGDISYVTPIKYTGVDINKYLGDVINDLKNEDLIQESFSLTESLCSQDNLKFGLCESAHCEFEVVGRGDKFIGKTVRPYITPITPDNFDYSNINFSTEDFSGATWWNTTNLRYYKKMNVSVNNDYLEHAKYVMFVATILIGMTVTSGTMPPKFYFGLVVEDQHGNSLSYVLNSSVATVTGSDRLSMYNTNDFLDGVVSDRQEVYITLPTDLSFDSSRQGSKITKVTGIYVAFADENGNYLTSDFTVDDFRIYNGERALYFVDSINSPVIHYDKSLMISDKIPELMKGIPLGVFKISEVKKNNTQDIIKKSITAYDNMSILEQNVGDWLTKYMWIWDTANKVHTGGSSFNRFGVEYARQLFPTLSNLMKQLNILTDDDFVFSFNVSDVDVEPANYNYGYNYLWGDFGDNPHGKGTIGILLASTNSASFSEDKLLKVTLTPYGNMTDEELFGKFAFSDMADYWGKNYHGFPSCASVFIILHNEDGTDTKILADSGDYIYINTKVTGYDVYYSAGIASINPSDDIMAAGFSNRMLTTHVNAKIYEVPAILKGLVNAHLRLVYYNYGTQELGSFDSSISGRDVLRSLLEVNGCFFHMNRYGKPEIIYASKAGLYPSEKLYPREDLYPRGMNGPLLSMSRYISMECDDYVVENYGKIQIKTQGRVKNGESICSYEYIGNPDGKNTYIIEDNIFYCAEGTVYEYGSQPEVDEMLKNLFDKISNLTYTPHTTKLRGLPFMECGDRVNLVTKTGGIESFIFRRTLKGIHALMDTYEASGDEYNEALNTFDYKVYTPT